MMLFTVPFKVMINASLVATGMTPLCLYGWYSTHSNSILNRIHSAAFDFYVGQLCVVFVILFAFNGLAECCGRLSIKDSMGFCAPIFEEHLPAMLFIPVCPFFSRQIMACLTHSLVSIFGVGLVIVFRERLNFLAFAASFGYDCVSHVRFLFKRLWSESIVARTAVDLFYIKRDIIPLSTSFRGIVQFGSF